MQTAPPMANHINIDGGKRHLNKAQAKPPAIVAPTIAVKGARKEIGKARARYPSKDALSADTGKVKRNNNMPTNATKPPAGPLAPATQIDQAKQTDAGPSTRKTRALFIKITPSLPRFRLFDSFVMAGLRPGHPRLSCCHAGKAWMPGTRPGMTTGASLTRPWKLPSAGARPWRLRGGSPCGRFRACRASSWSW